MPVGRIFLGPTLLQFSGWAEYSWVRIFFHSENVGLIVTGTKKRTISLKTVITRNPRSCEKALF